MNYTVYVMRSLSTGKLYTGQTENIERRLKEHQTQSGPVCYTKGRGPWEMVYSEEYPERAQAMAREKYLKIGAGRDFLKRQLSKKT